MTPSAIIVAVIGVSIVLAFIAVWIVGHTQGRYYEREYLRDVYQDKPSKTHDFMMGFTEDLPGEEDRSWNKSSKRPA